MEKHQCDCGVCIGVVTGRPCFIEAMLAECTAREDQRKAIVRAFFDATFGPAWVN